MTTDTMPLLDRISRMIDSDELPLPVISKVALEISKLSLDEEVDVGRIAQVIMEDQTLAADVLRAANSPFYCGLMPIRTIRNAIVRLGVPQVIRLVYLASERTKYQARDPQLMALLQELWRHSSTTAIAAQWLAKRLRSEDVEEECFLGGLLHDIGKLVILRALDEIRKTEESHFELSPPLIREVLDAAHCQLGHTLLYHWNIPELYCRIAMSHHEVELGAAELTMIIVRLANEASRKLSVGLAPDPTTVLFATPEAQILRTNEILLAELEIMLEDYLSQAA